MLKLLVKTVFLHSSQRVFASLYPYQWSHIVSKSIWISIHDVNYNIDLLYFKTWMLSLMSSRRNGAYFKVLFSSFHWQFSTQGQLISKSVILLFSLSTILASTLLAPTSGGKDDPSNYGPIALLPTSSRILEKAIHTQLNLDLNNNQLLTTNQYGFRLNSSTVTATATFTVMC